MNTRISLPFCLQPKSGSHREDRLRFVGVRFVEVATVVFIQGLLSGVAALGLHQLVMASQFGPVKVDLIARFAGSVAGSRGLSRQPLTVSSARRRCGRESQVRSSLLALAVNEATSDDNSDSLQNAGMSLRSGASASLQPRKRMRRSCSAWFSDATSKRNDPSSVRNSAWRATYPVSVCASTQGGKK